MEKSYEQQFWNLQYVLLSIWMLLNNNKKKKSCIQYQVNVIQIQKLR